MPEKRVAEMADVSGHHTFRVFAEWMKENREAWERHLAQQDKKLDEIHKEVRRTNGRVTELENRDKLVAALAENKREWETERSKSEKQAVKTQMEGEVRRSDRAWKTGSLFVTFLGGGIMGGVGHALGWW